MSLQRRPPASVLTGIDRKTELGRALRSVWVYTGGNGLADLGGIARMTPSASGAMGRGPYGGIFSTGASTTASASSSQLQLGTANFTVVVGLTINADPGGLAVAVSGGPSKWWFGSNSGTWSWRGGVSGGASITNWLGVPQLIVITRIGTALSVYRDGVLIASGTEADDLQNTTVDFATYAGSYFFGSVDYWFGAVAVGKGVSARRALEIAVDPWSLALKPAARYLFPAAVSTDATIASTETIDTTAITAEVPVNSTIAATETVDTAAITGNIIIKYDIDDNYDPITGTPTRILVPNANSANPYNAGTPTGVIIYVHGVGEWYDGLTADALKAGTVDALIDAGYILAGASDYGWGTSQSINIYRGLDKRIRDAYNVKNVCIWSQSMGGLSGLNLIAKHQVKGVVGWLGTYPICSLAAAYNGTGGTNFSSSIADALNFNITGSGQGTYANRTYQYDPLLLTGKSFRNVPMRFYASSSDVVVGKTQNTDAFRAMIAGSCRESTVVVCSGDHGDPSHFQPSDYVAFFARCFANPTPSSGGTDLRASFSMGAG